MESEDSDVVVGTAAQPAHESDDAADNSDVVVGMHGELDPLSSDSDRVVGGPGAVAKKPRRSRTVCTKPRNAAAAADCLPDLVNELSPASTSVVVAVVARGNDGKSGKAAGYQLRGTSVASALLRRGVCVSPSNRCELVGLFVAGCWDFFDPESFTLSAEA